MRFTMLLTILLCARTARADPWHHAYKTPFSGWSTYLRDLRVASTLPRAEITATDFKRDRYRHDVVTQLAVAARLSAKQAAQLRSTMRQFAAACRRDNVAHAMSLVIGLSFMVLEKEGVDDLITQINDALAASQFAKLGAAQRQLMHDSLLLSAAVIAIVHQSGDKAGAQAIAKTVLDQLLGV